MENAGSGIIKIEGTSIAAYIDGAYVLDSSGSIMPRPERIETAPILGGTYTASKTEMKYHQLKWLGKCGLLHPAKESGDREWRKYTFQDLVYFATIMELREFNIGMENLRGLYSLFCDTQDAVEQAILACLAGDEITLIFMPDGTGFVLSRGRLLSAESEDNENVKKPAIRLIMNQVVNRALTGMGEDPIEVTNTLGKMILHRQLDEREQRIIDAVRNNDFEELVITKHDGKPVKLYGKKTIHAAQYKRGEHDIAIMAAVESGWGKIEHCYQNGIDIAAKVSTTIKL